MAGPIEEREFRLGWSLWRRAHQAVAKRCHKASRAAVLRGASGKSEPSSSSLSASAAAATAAFDRGSARLTEEEWVRLRPLLPNNGHRGRQWREHRAVLEAILWVLLNGASWRELPEEFGPWQTAYGRYARWRREGLWQRIVEMLRCQPTKSPTQRPA